MVNLNKFLQAMFIRKLHNSYKLVASWGMLNGKLSLFQSCPNLREDPEPISIDWAQLNIEKFTHKSQLIIQASLRGEAIISDTKLLEINYDTESLKLISENTGQTYYFPLSDFNMYELQLEKNELNQSA